ncbi:MAG: hypothetical protein LBK27_06360 [Treponema sp.]|jgi:hypothetical protein|nr:hypothetical protein [Treponema sp.]
MDNESGAIEAGAVLLLFFLAAVLSGVTLFAASGITYFQRTKNDFNEKMEAQKLLEAIVDDMQELKIYPFDDRQNAVLDKLRITYDQYSLEITDVSSGYHLDFLSDEDLHDRLIVEYLFLNGNTSAFIRWRDENGLSSSTEKWREFIREEALSACVACGWIPVSQINSFAYRTVSASWAEGRTENLFPLVNDFPVMNVNMVAPEIFKPLIMRNAFKIEKAAEKFETLKNKLLAGPVMDSDMASILNIPLSHMLFGYLGTKTAFWKISFVFPGLGVVEGITAAIPKKDGRRQEIEEYRLIDRRFIP